MTSVVLPPSIPSRSGLLAYLAGTFALALGIAACGNARADTDAVRNLVEREAAAINGKDLNALSEIWSQDKDILLFDVPPPGRFEGWDQIGRLWKTFFDRVSDIHLTVGAVRADVQGSLAYATYDWSMTGRLGDYPLQDRGQATAIYRKEDGRWRLIHAHYSPVPPALVGLEPAAGGANPSGPPAAASGAALDPKANGPPHSTPAPAASPGAGTPAARGKP